MPEVVYRPLKEIKLLERNPRQINEDDFARLCTSIRNNPEYFQARPIILSDRTGKLVIIAGNMRYRAAMEVGLEMVPTFLLTGLTAEKEKEIIIRDNVSNGKWDFDLLANDFEFEDLANWGLDLSQFDIDIPGFSEPKNAKEDDFEIPDEIKTDIKPGDLIEIGPHRLLCGDSSNPEDVARLMDGKRADMVFTDPPYGVAYEGKTNKKLKIQNDDLSPEDLKAIVKKWFDCVDLFSRDGAYLLATVSAGLLHLIFAQDWLNRGWLRQIMVWNKSSMVLGHSEYHYKHEPILFGWKPGDRLKNSDRTKTTVWDFEKPSANREHPTMKPVKMWAYGIGNHTKDGDLLFEPFCGSGTTMVAAHQLDRICYGMELDAKYCQVIVDRMRNLDSSLVIKRNGVVWEV